MIKTARWLTFGSTTGLIMGANFCTGKLFVFGSVLLYADLTSHLGQIENFTPRQTIVGERSNNSKNFLCVTKINLGDTSNERDGVHLHTLEDR